MIMNIRKKFCGIASAIVMSVSLIVTVYASTSYSYDTYVEIDSQKEVVGARRTYKEKSIGVDVHYPSIGGSVTTSDTYTIEVGTSGILSGFSATQRTTRTLSEGCNNVIYFLNESNSVSTRSRAVKFKANYSSLYSDVRLYDC